MLNNIESVLNSFSIIYLCILMWFRAGQQNLAVQKCNKKNTFYSTSVFLRPLYNSNVPKVSLKKCSHNSIFLSGKPNVLEILSLHFPSQTFGYARNRASGQANQVLIILYNRYFCHITIIKLSQNFARNIQKYYFVNNFIFHFLFLISYWNPRYN